jgi:catechol 2,3-dioxygenase
MRPTEEPVPTAVGIGHVHLRVAVLDRAVAFYRDVLGLALNAYGPDL